MRFKSKTRDCTYIGSLPPTAYVKMVDAWLLFARSIPFVEVFIYLYFYLSISPILFIQSINISIHLSIHISILLIFHLSIHLYFHLSIYFHVLIYLSLYLIIFSIYLSQFSFYSFIDQCILTSIYFRTKD